jgi:hypothetical protein
MPSAMALAISWWKECPARVAWLASMFTLISFSRPNCGWDTDQFPNSVEENTLVMYEILKAGGFTTGGLNGAGDFMVERVPRQGGVVGFNVHLDLIFQTKLLQEAMRSSAGIPISSRTAWKKILW